jgi:hypothetical protein
MYVWDRGVSNKKCSILLSFSIACLLAAAAFVVVHFLEEEDSFFHGTLLPWYNIFYCIFISLSIITRLSDYCFQ